MTDQTDLEKTNYIKPKDDATFLLKMKLKEEQEKHPERFVPKEEKKDDKSNG